MVRGYGPKLTCVVKPGAGASRTGVSWRLSHESINPTPPASGSASGRKTKKKVTTRRPPPTRWVWLPPRGQEPEHPHRDPTREPARWPAQSKSAAAPPIINQLHAQGPRSSRLQAPIQSSAAHVRSLNKCSSVVSTTIAHPMPMHDTRAPYSGPHLGYGSHPNHDHRGYIY